MNQNDPMTRLRQANPVPQGSPAASSFRRTLRRTGQVLLAAIGILVVGVGVAWAASGVNPVASLFKDDMQLVQSEVGFDSFSILEPMTPEKFDSLSRTLTFRVSVVATRATTMENLRNGDPPFKEHGPSRTPGFDPIPANISAIGYGRSIGSEVTMLVINDEICTYWDQGRSFGICGGPDDFRRGIIVGWSSENRRPHLAHFYGVATDEVASIKIVGRDLPQIPVTDNVFELRYVQHPLNLRLIALDQDGNEVPATGAPDTD